MKNTLADMKNLQEVNNRVNGARNQISNLKYKKSQKYLIKMANNNPKI